MKSERKASTEEPKATDELKRQPIAAEEERFWAGDHEANAGIACRIACHTFVSDSDSTLVFSPSPVLDSVPRPAFNSGSATNHSSDLDEAEGKQFLHLLHFDLH
ncbi:hypothetical protein EVAR_102667_1 [Eumeta japonica]|uniref:Uncharacterized protein n=1 Tax=Eumeta variegata TaxID=151549 RepID=A0A4C1TV90_EUMVA|nr:hypothetical protein EVAR_102667_1 [Eumeta japonica]